MHIINGLIKTSRTEFMLSFTNPRPHKGFSLLAPKVSFKRKILSIHVYNQQIVPCGFDLCCHNRFNVWKWNRFGRRPESDQCVQHIEPTECILGQKVQVSSSTRDTGKQSERGEMRGKELRRSFQSLMCLITKIVKSIAQYRFYVYQLVLMQWYERGNTLEQFDLHRHLNFTEEFHNLSSIY